MNRVPAWFWFCFWFCLAMTSSSLAQTTITAEIGQTVTLLCKAPNNKTIKGVRWNRLDQKDDYVFLYRFGKLFSEGQLESYQNRVHLEYKRMKDGDVSLVLKNVTMEDKGRYECHVFLGREIELICIINLYILPPEHQDGNTEDGGNNDRIILGLIVIATLILVVLVAGVFLMYKRKPKVLEELKGISKILARQNSNSPPPPPVAPDDQAAEQLMTVVVLPTEQN